MKYAILMVALLGTTPVHALDMLCIGHRPIFEDRGVERPDLPTCQDGYGGFAEWEFDSCRSEIENYQRELNGYIDCLSSEADQAIDEYNQVVETFNRRARTPAPY